MSRSGWLVGYMNIDSVRSRPLCCDREDDVYLLVGVGESRSKKGAVNLRAIPYFYYMGI